MKKENNLFYTIKKNDTINSIAKKYNINPTKILIINHTSPNTLKEGSVLYIEK